MRLLNTRTGQFLWVNDPSSVRYAILSHTWDERGEQSYHDLLELQASVKRARSRQHWPYETDLANSVDPYDDLDSILGPPSILAHPELSAKIRNACAVALEDSYELLWVDACCIDQQSSAELTEAINSMFEWYRRADVCYVYFEDVDDDDDVQASHSQFRRARWHRRGWTLQELIAPRSILFLSRGWVPLGMKANLARLLEEVTGVNYEVLTQKASLNTVSVARRMCWASARVTTRIEDEAYSLMGIFGVHMAPIYGEGRNAFIRLQEAILKAIPDQSIFVWGRTFPPGERLNDPPVLHLQDKTFHMADDALPWMQGHSLLARSPSDFEDTASAIAPMSHKQFSARLNILDDLPLPEYTITSYGVRTQFPVIPASVLSLCLDDIHLRSDPAWTLLCECETDFQHVYLALLRCQNQAGDLIALPLCLPTYSFKEDMKQVFLVGTRVDACTTCPRPYRTWSLSPSTLARVRKHIYIADLRIRRSPLRALALLGPRFTPRQKKITEVVLNSRCIAALAAQHYQLGAPQRADNPVYRVHTFTFVRPTEARGCVRLTVRVVQSMKRGSDAVEFRVGYQSSTLPREEVMDRDSPLLPVAFVDLDCVNRYPGAFAIPIPGGMGWSVFDLHDEEGNVQTLRLTLRAVNHEPRLQLAVALSKPHPNSGLDQITVSECGVYPDCLMS